MCNLSKTEHEVLELALTSADDKIVAANLSKNGRTITDKEVRTYKSRARRKVAKAEQFLRDMKRYKPVLNPEKVYKGIGKKPRKEY
jgi:hypothetical protein